MTRTLKLDDSAKPCMYVSTGCKPEGVESSNMNVIMRILDWEIRLMRVQLQTGKTNQSNDSK